MEYYVYIMVGIYGTVCCLAGIFLGHRLGVLAERKMWEAWLNRANKGDPS